jgi:ABC-type glycerol-3-phosphate transport system permease component
VVAVVTVLSVALSAFTGWSLLKRKPWGRTLSIVAAILALLKFPFGTALGIYTLWVMVPAEAAMEWEAIAEAE